MGLLDNLDDPRTQMLLTMGMGLLGGGQNFGSNLSRAGMAGLGAYNAGTMRQAKLAEEKQQAELRAMALADAKHKQAFRDALSQGYNPGAPAAPYNDALGDGGAGTIPGQAPSWDFSKAMSVDPLMGFQAQQTMRKTEAPVSLSEGAVLVDPITGKTVYKNEKKDKPAFQPGQTRTFKAGRVEITQEYQPNGTWKTIGNSSLDKPDDGMPKAPNGYRWKPDMSGLEPIPGGPADAKVGKEADALRKREEGAISRADVILGSVKDAISQVGPTTTGWVGGLTRDIPSSPAYNLNRVVDTIKANIGFQELQAMREASPTGGALGQVAVQELNMLHSVLGSLDTAQNDDQLLKSLYAVEKHFNNWKQAVKQAREQGASQGGKADPLGLRDK